MLWLLLACVDEPEVPAQPVAPVQPPPRTHQRLAPLPLPDVVPFRARSRILPLTVVDEHGQPLLVIEALGVEFTIERLLADRAYGSCSGCRAEVTGWFQRKGLLVSETVADAALSREESLVAWLDSQDLEVLDHGVIADPQGWVSPPWHDEGGYAGPVVQISRLDGGFAARVHSTEDR